MGKTHRRIHGAVCILTVLLLATADGPRAADAKPSPDDARPENSPRFELPRHGGGSRGELERRHWRRNFFKRVGTDQKFLVTTWAPEEFRRPRFALPLAVVAAGASRSSFDRPGVDYRLSRSLARWGQGGCRGAAESFTRLGDGPTGMVLVGSTYLIARWSGKTRLARASSLSAEAMANTAIWSSVLK